ncbi:hypothetical protein F5I97DRAFT_1435591 [Phlebopus sp. FC_14]|nr:hypothetical protein F5I97DRAFT_1435591 [Phlebopus sp. FC_14]
MSHTRLFSFEGSPPFVHRALYDFSTGRTQRSLLRQLSLRSLVIRERQTGYELGPSQELFIRILPAGCLLFLLLYRTNISDCARCNPTAAASLAARRSRKITFVFSLLYRTNISDCARCNPTAAASLAARRSRIFEAHAAVANFARLARLNTSRTRSGGSGDSKYH